MTAVSSEGVRSLRVRKWRFMDGTSQMRGQKKEKRPFGGVGQESSVAPITAQGL